MDKQTKKTKFVVSVNSSLIGDDRDILKDAKIHLNRSLVDYIHSMNEDTFSLSELDNLCNDICEKILEQTDKELYKHLLSIHKLSDSGYKNHFVIYIASMYYGKLEPKQIKTIINKFSKDVKLYRSIIDNSIMSNKDIDLRANEYYNEVRLDVIREHNKIRKEFERAASIL